MSGLENRYSTWAKKSTNIEPQLEEEKLLQKVLWEKYEEHLKSTLTNKLGRTPSDEEMKEAFNVSIGVMRETGLLEKILNRCRQNSSTQSNP